MRYDWLVVGAGFTGSVVAEQLASRMNKRVLLIDKRSHIGGNAYDCYDDHGIAIHKYGPHIFHTNDDAVWDYLSKFTEWRPYEHRVLAAIDGKYVPVPFNLNSLEAVFSAREAARVEKVLVEIYGMGRNVSILDMCRHPHGTVSSLAEYVYEKVFKGYSVKQWGLRPEELEASVSGRVPVRISRDNRYFQDKHQAMPKDGFTALFRRITSHPNIDIALNTEYAALPSGIAFGRVVYTGPIDSFFNHAHGELPYRSLRFEFHHARTDRIQPAAVINYPDGRPYTRVTEFKHLTGQSAIGTSFVREYPEAHQSSVNDPYYPVLTPASAKMYSQYAADAAVYKETVLFAGRLGDFRYYNMDQAIARALALTNTLAQPQASLSAEC